VALAITALAVAVLVVFYVGAVASGAFDWRLLGNIPPEGSGSTYFPRGAYGVFAAIPFAIWFYLAIEQLPLAAEESVDVVRDMPRALLAGIATLLLLSLLTLLLNAGVGGGAAAIARSPAPLGDGFVAVFGRGATTAALTLVALAGLVASFHAIIYAYGRVLFALSRAGYFPRWLSVTGRVTRTPHRALLAGALVGFLAAFVMDRFGRVLVGAALLNMAVFAAVLSYVAVLLSYIRLRRTRPDLPRPYRSPLGVPGAWLGIALALLSLTATFAVPEYRPGVYGVAFFLLLAVAYFAAYSSRRLVAQAPEEEAALTADPRPRG
jgi:ethanolamine permease